MKYFTYLWKREGVQAQKFQCIATGEFELDHAVGSEFEERGVSPGDYLYILHLYRKQVYVLTRLQVDRITSQYEATQHFLCQAGDIRQGEQHVIASPSPLYFDKALSQDQFTSVRYFSKTHSKFVKFKIAKNGGPDPMSLRGVHEIPLSNARMLDSVLGVQDT